MSQSWTLTIPAPAPWLNANQRTDLRRQTPDRRAWRDAAHTLAKAAKLPALQAAYILAILQFTDKRRRDPHNYYPTIKAVVDGLVDYGLLPDDSSKYLAGPDVRLGEPLRSAAVRRADRLVLTIRDRDPLAGYFAPKES